MSIAMVTIWIYYTEYCVVLLVSL